MYLDTDILYALIDIRDQHHELTEEIIQNKEKKYSSVTALIELEFVVKREIGDEESKEVLEKIEQVVKIEFRKVDRKIFELSAELRKKHGLAIMDSKHAACALLNDKRIASTDGIYDRIKELKRIY